MKSLAALQAAFRDATQDTALAPALFGDTAAGIDAYANNILFNRVDALVEAFPVTRQLVGDAFFEGMARAAARRQASRSGDLNRYGAEFADFIAAFPPAQSLPYLADAARVDWLAHRAYYAADAAPLELARLATLDADAQAGLRFELSPAVGLLVSNWPAASIWRAHQTEDSPDHDDFPSPDQGGERVLVWRDGRRVRVMRLGPAEYAFLGACQRSQPLTEALECALDLDMEFDLGLSLQRWINDQVIVNYQERDFT
ncbi:MAG: putative DNA-binding domain-containing protein [Burkholderiales bacterium]|nr:putative DNA-binding domain-containing protein [Burkholderiales bacterium]